MPAVKRGGITVIVVSRGQEALLRLCLLHVRRALGRLGLNPVDRIVVVDNASETPYRDDLFGSTMTAVIRFDRHASFASANNAAARKYANSYYCMVNNDVLLDEGALCSMVELVASNASIGICGSRLLFPDDTIQHDGVVFGAGSRGPYHVNRGTPRHLAPSSYGEWQAVTGACMLIRHETWGDLDGLCEDYPFGLEDIDFCLRARQRGWRIVCARSNSSLHFESMTAGRSEMDIPSRKLFMSRWSGKYTVDG